MSHIHLDLLGGLSGDMFISGMLDAFPALGESLAGVIEAAGFPEMVRLEQQPHDDGTLTGTRFRVHAVGEAHHHGDGHHHHHHRHYSDIRSTLEGSRLDPSTRSAALSMFRLLAEVEAAIHGKSVDEVAFHEVGAWDSIADIVLAAHLISACGARSWSVSRVPLGSGFVETAHGRLPVPAPATARLLEGFEVFDDGVEGERVTPTGAVILKYLAPERRVAGGQVLERSGYGFGTRQFEGFSNVVRVTVYTPVASDRPWDEDQVVRLQFEIDDQSPEEVAQALEQLRAEAGVLDVVQGAYWGKKARQGIAVSVLASPGAEHAVMARCFDLTSTLGIRREQLARAILRREQVTVYVNERAYRVKVAVRPGGRTAKVEMDDLVAAQLSPDEQKQVRATAERLALEQVD